MICHRTNFLTPIAAGLLLGAMACGQVGAQGVLQFENNATGHRAPIYGVDACQCAKSGNTATGLPAGGQTYSGALLAGTGFTIELWAAPSDAPDTALAPVGRTSFRTGLMAGFFVPINVTVPGVAPGGLIKCLARAYNNASGTLTSWSQAQCAGAESGASVIFPAGPIPVSGSVQTINLRSFCLVQHEALPEALFLTITRNANTTALDRFGVNHLLTGDDVQINATGSALQSPTLRLQWRQNGLDLEGATGATLDLALVEVSQTGPYSLLATDGDCSNEVPFELLVHPPPSLRQPRVDAQGNCLATVVAAPFRMVTVEASTNLFVWSDASTGTADAKGNFEFSQPVPGSPTGFFLRARVAP